jgi:hypothetical protein
LGCGIGVGSKELRRTGSHYLASICTIKFFPNPHWDNNNEGVAKTGGTGNGASLMDH